MSEASLETIYREVKDLRMLIESLAETLDVLSESDRGERREALTEHEKGETLTLEEAAKTLCAE
jgi:hypothetical protein